MIPEGDDHRRSMAKMTSGEKRKFTVGEHLSGLFLVHNLLGSRLPPPLPSYFPGGGGSSSSTPSSSTHAVLPSPGRPLGTGASSPCSWTARPPPPISCSAAWTAPCTCTPSQRTRCIARRSTALGCVPAIAPCIPSRLLLKENPPPPPRAMHWKAGAPPPPTGRPATVPLTASARLNGICNRQQPPQPLWQPPPTTCLTASGAAPEVPCLLMHALRPPPPVRGRKFVSLKLA